MIADLVIPRKQAEAAWRLLEDAQQTHGGSCQCRQCRKIVEVRDWLGRMLRANDGAVAR